MNEQKFTTDQIAKYISGWMIAPPDEPVCDAYINALHNAKAMLEDEQDGIAAYFERIERKPTNTPTTKI